MLIPNPEPASAAERKAWDRLSTRMTKWHDIVTLDPSSDPTHTRQFRQSFNQIWSVRESTPIQRPTNSLHQLTDSYHLHNYTLRSYLAMAEDFERGILIPFIPTRTDQDLIQHYKNIMLSRSSPSSLSSLVGYPNS